MSQHSKRLSILTAPEFQELYSIPKLNPQEQEYFFTLTDEELAIVNRLNTTRNRIHLILMLGYFRIKRVCLVYNGTIKRFQRFDKATEETVSSHLISRSKHYMDHRELFYDALTWIRCREIAVSVYSTLQNIISTVINNEETRLSDLIKINLSDREDLMRIINVCHLPLLLLLLVLPVSD